MKNLIRLGTLLVLMQPVTSHADAIAQWHFDEAPGATVAVASIGGVNGALSGSAVFVPGGISGNAISLSRVGNGLVNMGDNFDLTSGDFTIVVWVKTAPNYAAPDSVVLAKHRATVVAGYVIGVNANGAYGEQDKAWFYDSNGTPGDDPRSTTPVNDGQWHQVIALYRSGGSAEIHVDGPGVEDSKSADPIGTISARLLIGGLEFGTVPTSLFDGLVDELQIYDRALNACQLQFLFDNPGQVAPADCDQDGIDDDVDNCALVANPSQLDTNSDGFGNLCDPDIAPIPGNCVVNATDLGALKAAFFSMPGSVNWNPDADFNGDSAVNAIDLGVMKQYFFGTPGPNGSGTCP